MNQVDFFAYRVVYFWKKFPNQIKNSSSVKKTEIKLDGFRKNGKKKKLKGHFCELSDEFLNGI